ncbi:hypothetical protein GCM10027034_34870 [Ramlibacter solisilvae]|uniref:Uncharacterized protein n=1 Tax=Ramlibacter tataouinensis TaxID=94132 RepID=A0A127JSJ4_9BURK|nr:hypothetical protein [Ramlibacter tataouinensis]AMO22968.1 hypothetical protein UC35_08795 [Ramlibacter tataouinensis]
MPRPYPALALLAVAACTPTFNWREVSVAPTPLKAVLPCKPDKAERRLEITPGREVVVHALGCEAGHATFVVLYAELPQAGELGETLARWKGANLAASKAKAQSETPFQPAGALGLPQSVQVRAEGQRSDGSVVQSQSAYFARGTQAFQAVIYAPRITAEMSEPFFAGLRFE